MTQVEIAGFTGLSPATVSNMVKELDTAGRGRARAEHPQRPPGRPGVAGHRQHAASRGSPSATATCGSPSAPGRATSSAASACRCRPTTPPTRAWTVPRACCSTSSRRPARRWPTCGRSGWASRRRSTRVSGQVGSESILPGWRGVAVAAEMEGRIQAPVAVDNTSNLAALGELRCGVLQGVQHGVYIKLSYGVGAGLILDGDAVPWGRGHGRRDRPPDHRRERPGLPVRQPRLPGDLHRGARAARRPGRLARAR